MIFFTIIKENCPILMEKMAFLKQIHLLTIQQNAHFCPRAARARTLVARAMWAIAHLRK